MDLAKQKRIEPLRYIPIVGGCLLGFSPILIMKQADLAVCAGMMPAILGIMLVGMGVWSAKIRRLLFSYEARLQKIEQEITKLRNGNEP